MTDIFTCFTENDTYFKTQAVKFIF